MDRNYNTHTSSSSQVAAPRQSEYHDVYESLITHFSKQHAIEGWKKYPNQVRQQDCIDISTATTYRLIGDEATQFRIPTLFKIPLLIQKVKIVAQRGSLSLFFFFFFFF
jgi:hypothetical protein